MDDLNLEIYDLVDANLFTRQKGPAVTIKNDGITFNSECLAGMEHAVYIQIIMDKLKKRMFVVECREDDRDALRWCNVNEKHRRPRKLSGKGFADLLFQMMSWDVRNRYIVRAEMIEIKGKSVYQFQLSDAEKETDYKINRIVNLLKNVDGVVIPDDVSDVKFV